MASILLQEDYISIIKNTLDTTDFKLLQIKESPIGEDEAGLLGEHFKAEITVLQKNSSQQQILHYFIKIKPRGQGIHRDLINNTNVFEKESRVYNELYSELKKIHFEVQSIRKHKASFWFCNCYLSREDVIVLEDVSPSGFRMQSARIPLNYKQCAIVLKALARLHAVSIVYEEKQLSAKGLNLKELHPDVFFESICVKQKQHLGYKLCCTSQKGLLSLCQYMPNFGKNSKHYKLIQENLVETLDQLFELVKPSCKFRNVLCHGDLWTNNVMFKYDSDGEPEDIRIIDLQLLRYCPPGLDIMMFLHLTTTRSFRQTYTAELLRLYYKAFTAELELHQLQAQNILPWTELQAGCEEYSVLGLILASLYFEDILLCGDKAKVIKDSEKMKHIIFEDKSDFLIDVFKSDPVFRERITEATEELIERCIINIAK